MMTCNACGASIVGNTLEMVAWDAMHRTQCPGPAETSTTPDKLK